MFDSVFISNNRKIKGFKREIEPQEVLLDKLAQKKEKEVGVSGKKLEVLLSNRILKVFLIFFFCLLSLFFIKTFQLQIVEGKKYAQLAEKNKFKIYQTQAERGIIYDKFGNQLVWNNVSYDLAVDSRQLPKDEKAKQENINTVAGILKITSEEIESKIKNSKDYQTVVFENLDHQNLVILEAKIEDLAGFQIVRNWVRDYKLGPAFSHLIGYNGKIQGEELQVNPDQYSVFDWVGRSGLEKSYEEALRKNSGKVRVERDVYGNVLSEELISLPESGKSLVLWTDAALQKKIYQEVKKAMEERNGKSAVAIAMDPKTGGILALVSLPDFDNNLFQNSTNAQALKAILESPEKPLYNRAIAGLFPTGSTIKPLIASAALQEKIISPDKTIYDSGQITIVNQYNPGITYAYKDLKAHGTVDMRKALAVSCNVYFYTIGGGYKDQAGLGPTLIKKYLNLFGWGEKTQIDLPGEKEGFVPSPEWKKEAKKEGWKDGDTYHMSIGQGDLSISPLEVVTAFAAIANNGKLLKPQVVQKIISGTFSNQEKVEEISPEIIRENFIDPANLQVVREGMRQAVTSPEGSSYFLSTLSVKAASKTGTAEIGKPGYYDKWITVFAPYDDPQIVLTIMVEGVKGYQTTVLPAARNILSWYFSGKPENVIATTSEDVSSSTNMEE